MIKLYKKYLKEVAGFETAGNIGSAIASSFTKSGKEALKRNEELRKQGKFYGNKEQTMKARMDDPEFVKHATNIPKSAKIGGKIAGQALYGGALAGAGYAAYKAYKKYKQKKEDDKYLDSIIPKNDENVEESYVLYLNNN